MPRSLVPFTAEDQGLYKNLPIVNILRKPIVTPGWSQGSTSANPPSFFEADQQKWTKKFKDAIKERQFLKKKIHQGRAWSHLLECNENLNPQSPFVDGDLKLKAAKYTGGQIKPEVSEFKKVLKRRKSRQSTSMPTAVDFEYKGNSGTLEQYVRRHNKTQLDFEFNLRGY